MVEITLLSVLQGLAEFLPISSSGHLVLGKRLLGLQEMGMRIDIFLHVGTLLAIFAFYFSVVRRIVVNWEWPYVLKVVLSAIPVGIVGILWGDRIESNFQAPVVTGSLLIVTGLVLLVTRFLPNGGKDVSFGRAIIMGLAQAIAILPGISRSGMTLAAARAAKTDAEKAAEFSFLMSAPPIVGAAFLKVLGSVDVADGGTEVGWGLTIYGCMLAAVVGYFSLKLLLKSLKGCWFWLFGPYCIFVGVLLLVFRRWPT